MIGRWAGEYEAPARAKPGVGVAASGPQDPDRPGTKPGVYTKGSNASFSPPMSPPSSVYVFSLKNLCISRTAQFKSELFNIYILNRQVTKDKSWMSNPMVSVTGISSYPA